MKDREQRLTMRVLTTWRTLCRGTLPPRRSQIDPMLFGADWGFCMMIDLDPDLERSRLGYVGSKLRDASWPPLDRQTMAECEPGTLLHAMLSYAPRMLAKGLPISTGGVVNYEGEPVIYRSILLPVAESSGRIDGLLAAASFRVISVEEEIHPFQDHRLNETVEAGD